MPTCQTQSSMNVCSGAQTVQRAQGIATHRPRSRRWPTAAAPHQHCSPALAPGMQAGHQDPHAAAREMQKEQTVPHHMLCSVFVHRHRQLSAGLADQHACVARPQPRHRTACSGGCAPAAGRSWSPECTSAPRACPAGCPCGLAPAVTAARSLTCLNDHDPCVLHSHTAQGRGVNPTVRHINVVGARLRAQRTSSTRDTE